MVKRRHNYDLLCSHKKLIFTLCGLFFIVGDKLSRQLGLVQSHQQGPPIGKMPLRCACPIKVTHAGFIFFRLQVHYHLNQTHFHMKVFARGLVLKQRHKVTRKWSIIEQTLGIVKKNKNRVFFFCVSVFLTISSDIFKRSIPAWHASLVFTFNLVRPSDLKRKYSFFSDALK